jgi:hypothetical protein
LRIGPPSSGFGNEILAWGPSPLPSVDFANQMPAVTVQPFDDASHTIQYQVTSGATPNFIVGEFFTSSGTWVIVAPHRSEGLVFPRMPAGTLKVVPDDGIIQFGVVTGGYDTIRTNYPFGRNSLTREYDEMYRAGAFPAQGSLIVSNAVVDP